MTDEILQLLGWHTDAVHIALALALMGRIYHAARTNGGLVGIVKALLYGTNTPASIATPVLRDSQPSDPPPDPPDTGNHSTN